MQGQMAVTTGIVIPGPTASIESFTPSGSFRKPPKFGSWGSEESSGQPSFRPLSSSDSGDIVCALALIWRRLAFMNPLSASYFS